MKYRPQMTSEAVNNNLNILVDSTFTNVTRLFVLSHAIDDNNYNRQSYFQFYLPKSYGNRL